jgi:hypothetical protein
MALCLWARARFFSQSSTAIGLIVRLAHRRGATALAGADSPGPARAFYRPPYLEHREDRACFPRAVECRGTLPTGQQRWGGAIGSFSSVVRQLSATTHLRHRDWPRTGQPGTPGKRHSKVRTGHDENAVRHRSDISPNTGEAAGTPCHGSTRAGSDTRAAVLCRDLRTRTMDACTSFI